MNSFRNAFNVDPHRRRTRPRPRNAEVLGPGRVATLVNGNDVASVIDAVSELPTGGWERPIARACCISTSST